MIRNWIHAVTVAVLLIPGLATAQKPSKEDIEILERELKATPRTLRPAVNRSLCQFVQVEGDYGSYTYPDSPIFPPDSPQLVDVRDLELRATSVLLRVRSRKFDGSITIEPAAGRPISIIDLRAVLAEVFQDFHSTDHAPIVGNSSSQVYHAYASNHLPEKSARRPFENRGEAGAAGFKPCPVCFVPRPKVSDFQTERMLGKFWAGEVRRNSALIDEGAETARIDSIGKDLLAKWPVPTKGYEYVFRIVDDDAPNAFACPAGAIFVTKGLLRSIEDDQELRGVLAHEICHVERRHGYRQYQRAQRSALIAALVGTAVGVASDIRGIGVVATTVAAIASAAILAGYSRAEEAEADTYALAALGLTDRQASEGFQSILHKIQQYESVDGRMLSRSNGFRSHPSLESRLARARVSDPRLFKDPPTFVGYDSDDNPLVSISLESQVIADFSDIKMGDVDEQGRQRHFKGAGRTDTGPKVIAVHESVVFATVVAFPDLDDVVKVSEISIKVDGKTRTFDNREDTELYPGDDVGMSFSAQVETGAVSGKISDFSCTIPGVTRWERKETVSSAGLPRNNP